MGTTFKITMNKALPAIQAMLEELGEAFHTSCYQVDDQQQCHERQDQMVT